MRARLEHAEGHVLAPLDRALFRDLLQRLATRANTLDPVASACDLVTEPDGPEPGWRPTQG
jgi:hypothetical protein